MRLEELLAPYDPPDTSLVDRLQYWAQQQPDALAFAYLADGHQLQAELTYAQLDRRARAVAGWMQQQGWAGQRALLMFPPGLDFVVALLGCLYGGVIGIPAYPPRKNRNTNRIEAMAADAQATLALTTQDVRDRTRTVLQRDSYLASMHWLTTDQIETHWGERYEGQAIGREELAILQYTSGSTGSPKGVMLTHRNLMHNCSLITTAFQAGREAIGASWLPTYHDMGLVGGIFNPLFCGRPSYLMSPMTFLQKPVRWLEAITRFKVTISGGPNFAYDLCTRKITDEELRGLDLSSWALAFNGAEPVRHQTLEQFTRRFAPVGFRHTSFYPCYGMAETTLIVTGGRHDQPPAVRCYDGSALDEGRVAMSSAEDGRGRLVVGCGQALAGEEICIVDPDTHTLMPPGRVGEIWIHSESVGRGYWQKPEETRETFQARLAGRNGQTFLRSGDLGFFHRNELFVTGRLKDLIIIRGVNRYPQDIEMTVERADPRLRNGATAAFAVDVEGRERLVVVSEVERGKDDQWDPVIDAIRRAVTSEHELPPDGVVLVRTGSIPKTSSGKIQRHACRQEFLDNTLMTVARRCLWEEESAAPSGSGAATSAGSAAGEPVVAGWALDAVLRAVREVGRERAADVTPETNIVQLGLDSLERIEVLNRLEEQFGGQFPEEILQEIETCREVAEAIEKHLGPDRQPGGATRRPLDDYASLRRMPEYLQLKRTMEMLQSSGEPNPYFRVHAGVARDTTVVDGQRMISFATYNYLGMSGDPEVSRAAKKAIDRYGTSVSASRLVSGEKPLHQELERALADFLGIEDTICFVGGHSTNETTIGHLFGPGDLILHDALAHNSIIQGAILSGARRRPFPHNDWQALDDLLREIRHQYRRVLVAIEGAYSMDGDYPELPRFIEVKQRHRALLMVDEAHSLGTMGPTGRGISEFFQVDPQAVDLWMGTLSKSLGSCGGFIGGCREAIEYLRYTAPGFVFSVGLSPPNAASALASLGLLERQPERARQCIARAQLFLELARARGLNTGGSRNTPIVPVILGNSLAALQLSRRLFERQINVQPILYPAVEESAARLRFFVTACHSESQIRQTVEAVAEELAQVAPGLPRSLSSLGPTSTAASQTV